MKVTSDFLKRGGKEKGKGCIDSSGGKGKGCISFGVRKETEQDASICMERAHQTSQNGWQWSEGYIRLLRMEGKGVKVASSS